MVAGADVVEGDVVDDPGCGPCFSVIHIGHIEKECMELVASESVRVLGCDMVLFSQVIYARADIVMDHSIRCERHAECPPAEFFNFWASEIVAAWSGTEEEPGGIFLESWIGLAIEMDEHAGPIRFQFAPVPFSASAIGA